jgi:predicted nucleic acid-binding protein
VIAYLDSSVILRVVLNQPSQLPEWKTILTGITSALAEVECIRTIDRLRVLGQLSSEQSAMSRETTYRVLEELEILELTPNVLRRASQSQSVPLGSLDALHLVSAELWRDAMEKERRDGKGANVCNARSATRPRRPCEWIQNARGVS